MRYLGKARKKNVEYEYATVDIETLPGEEGSPLLGETCYISWCFNGVGYGSVLFNLTEWMIDVFLTYRNDGMILYCHNGFRFDYQRIDWHGLSDRGYDVEFLSGNDGNIKSAKIIKDECTWFLRDSVLLIPLSLAKLTKTFVPDTQKYKRKLSFDVYPFNPFDMEDVHYAVVDATSLYKAIGEFDRILRQYFDVTIHEGATLPSLAFKAFRLGLVGKSDVKAGLATEDEIEKYEGISYGCLHAAIESYHGGQTIAFQTKLFVDVLSADANSMYPCCMLKFPLPTGKVLHHYGLPKNLHDNILCLAIVSIPNKVFPLIKSIDSRNRTGNFRGVVSGWYWYFELEKQKELGAEYTVIESYEWTKTTDAAMRFSQKCHDLRMTDYLGGLGYCAKNMNNSVYGRFAMKVAEMIVQMSETIPDESIPVYNPSTRSVVQNLYYVKSKPNFSADMTHWASYITARARCELTDAINLIGFDKVIYCDTDSIFFERIYINRIASKLGKEYGEFKIEKGDIERGIIFQAIAPKAYKAEEEVYNKEEKHFERKKILKNKGIPSSSLYKQNGFIRIGRANMSIKYIQTKSLFVKLKTESGYGRKSMRKVATTISTTNGIIENDKWHPIECECRDLETIRGSDVKTPTFMKLNYKFIIEKYRKELKKNERKNESTA